MSGKLESVASVIWTEDAAVAADAPTATAAAAIAAATITEGDRRDMISAALVRSLTASAEEQ